MALLSNSMNSKSSNQHLYTRDARKMSSEPVRRNTQASAYAVNADTQALASMHFSTYGAGGVPSPPPSPPVGGMASSLRSDGSDRSSGRRSSAVREDATAARHITEESERLFCETLRAVFLVEKDTARKTSLVMDVHNNSNSAKRQHGSRGRDVVRLKAVPPAVANVHASPAEVREYLEMWDYAGGARFRGFVASSAADEEQNERTMFVFFDKEVMSKDLKPGVMALLELAPSPPFSSSQLVVCLDRSASEVKDVIRDLGWVGFELLMLDRWAGKGLKQCVSDQWIFMGMDV